MRPTFDGVPAEEWIHGLKEMHDNNIKHILSTFAYFGVPKSFLDVGCGDGVAVETARALGAVGFGVDQIVQEDWPDYYFYQNLVDAFRLPEPVDMIYTLEVAEHLHETAHGTFLDTLTKNLADGGIPVFTAALPGQDGTGHTSHAPSHLLAQGTHQPWDDVLPHGHDQSGTALVSHSITVRPPGIQFAGFYEVRRKHDHI